MGKKLNNSELGRRLSFYRSQKGLSQEELATFVGISRSSLAQIELGNRNVTAVELLKLAEQLNFSLDEIMSADFNSQPCVIEDDVPQEPAIRISVPTLKVEKFKNLILYILERCAGRPNIGETVLYKLLYFSDFNYYEIYEEHLSGATYRKLAMGPVPRDITEVLHEMETANCLRPFTADYFGYKQKRYIPLVSANKKLFNGAELEVVDKVIDQLGGMSAAEISRYSHGDMPWKASKERQEIDYELAFYREAPYSVRTYNDECDD